MDSYGVFFSIYGIFVGQQLLYINPDISCMGIFMDPDPTYNKSNLLDPMFLGFCFGQRPWLIEKRLELSRKPWTRKLSVDCLMAPTGMLLRCSNSNQHSISIHWETYE